MTGSVTFSTGIGGDGSTVTDDNNATTGLRDGGWRTRFVPCFTNQVSIANYVVTQANAASASATAAGSSATSAAAAYDSFDDRYLGSKTSDPTLDNDGNALLTGALYWNSTSSVMKVYSGSAWVSAYVPSSSYLALTGGTMTGAITFASAQFGTNVNTFLTTPSSANLAVALTDKTGTGVNVFNNTPTLITPILGTPQSGTLTNCTGLPLSAGITGTLPVANGGTNSTATPTAGGAIYGTGTAYAITSAGTTGQVLTSNGSSAPTWATASSGALVFLSTVTASASATVDIENTFDSTYDAYLIVASGVTFSVSTMNFYARMKLGGSYLAGTGYRYHSQYTASNSDAYTATSSDAGGSFFVAYNTSSTAGESCSFTMQVYNPSSTTIKKMANWSGGIFSASSRHTNIFGSGHNTSTSELTGIRFFADLGTITGEFRLYGIAKS